MKCLYCGKRILAFRLFSGGETFCSEEHGELYRKNEAESAIQRILTLDAPKKPLRMTPAPVVAAIPAISEPEPPPMAGFRLPVVAANNYVGEAVLGPLPISLEILTPSCVVSASVQPVSSYFDLAWSSGAHTVCGEVTPLPAPHRQRTPLAPVPGFTPSARGPLRRVPWEPRPHSLLRLGEALTVQTTERLRTITAVEFPTFSLDFAGTTLGWFALADGQAQLSSAASGLEAAPAIAMPYLPQERFVSTWRAHRMLALWTRGHNEVTSGAPPFAEVSSALCASLRLPVASAERDAQPSATTLASLWRMASDVPRPVAEIAAGTSPVLPALGELESAKPALRTANLGALPLASRRPFPAIPRLAPEPALELSFWNAWPDLPRVQLAPVHVASIVANGHTWRPLAGNPNRMVGRVVGRSAAAGLRLLDAPERCRTLALTLPAESSALRLGALLGAGARTGDWPLAAAAPAPHVRPLATMISPRETVHPPAQNTPAIHQPLAFAPVRSVAPAAAAPPVASWPLPELGRQEVALRLVSHSSQDGAAAARPLASVPLRPAVRLAAQAPAPELALTSGPPASPDVELRYPSSGPSVAIRLAEVPGATSVWGCASQGRPLDASLSQPRETPLRLSVEEIPCSCTLDVQPPAAQPVASTWTSLSLLPARAPREFASAMLADAVHTLRAPGLLIASRAASVTQAHFAAPVWTGRQAAPEPVVRRRQLPASRPKMNLPRPLPLKGSIALPGLTQLAEILGAERQATSNAAMELVER